MKRIVVMLMMLIVVTTVQAQETVGYNEPVTGEFTEDEFEYTYTFSGSKGDVVILLVKAVAPTDDFTDSLLIVTDPDGNVIADTTDAPTYQSSIVALELVSSGDYTATVTREDGVDGESYGEFTFEVVQAQALDIGEPVTGFTDSDSRNQYYYVHLNEEFGVSFNKTAGDFYPAVTLSTLDSTYYDLDNVATAFGDEMEHAVMLSFDADVTYILTVGEPRFAFNFQTVTADYELELIASK